MSDRVERNYKMAHAASPNVSLPPSKAYRDNWDSIFKKSVNRSALRKWQANAQPVESANLLRKKRK